MEPPMRIAVLQGGPSAEAEVSRVSAAGVATALASVGHVVVRLELDRALPAALLAEPYDVVFPVLHGPFGEDGSVQGLLDVLGMAYVGSGVLASAIAADKVCTKTVLAAAGVPLAKDALVRRGEDLAEAAKRVRAVLGRAVFVKPHAQGSAIGVTPVRAEADDAALVAALENALALDDVALCEKLLVGREVTCGVLDARPLGPTRALPPTEIRAKLGDFYDFKSKYAKGGSEHVCPADLPPAVTARVQDLALAAHRAVGCRDLSRVDFVVGDGDDRDAVHVLEVNTMPGMTPTSLYPEAAAVAGIPMQRLVDGLARAACDRGPREKHAGFAMP
jgi:D-alanine-D-alanine ligase